MMIMQNQETYHCRWILVLSLLATTSCLVITAFDPADVKFVSLETKSHESLQAVYVVGDNCFNVTTRVHPPAAPSWREEEPASDIISVIQMTEMGSQGPSIQRLSQIVLPGKYLRARMIPDMEERIIQSAMVMAQILTKQELSVIVHVYDAIVHDLTQRIDIQSNFNQGHASVIYQKSIARTAQRLVSGVAVDKACPAYQAYEHQGLFACQQEYDHHARMVRKVISSPLKCSDFCTGSLKSVLGGYLSKEVKGASLEEAVTITEDVLSLGNNSKLAEEVARLIACGNISCKEPGCSSWLFTEGWFIYGADWGCCGDYPECCLLATEVCLVHDAICTCCSFPEFCLDPFCKPDPWCSNVTSTAAP